jgi:predicted nucleic-acid-binding protein
MLFLLSNAETREPDAQGQAAASTSTSTSGTQPLTLQVISSVLEPNGKFDVTLQAPFLESSAEEVEAINLVKKNLVVEWLNLKRKSQYEASLGDKNLDEYILYISKKRISEKRDQLKIVGELALDQLNKWVHTSDTTSQSKINWRPVFVGTVNLPGLQISSSDSAAKIQDNPYMKNLWQYTLNSVQKFKFKLSPLEGKALSLQKPEVTPSFIDKLKTEIGSSGNAVIWVDTTQCIGCGSNTIKVDTYFYNLAFNRVEIADSQELTLSLSEIANPNKLQAALKNVFQNFNQQLEERISSGKLMSAVYVLKIRAIRRPDQYQWINKNLLSKNLFTTAQLKYFESGSAEYEVQSTFSKEELIDRLKHELMAQPELKVSIR